MDIRPEYLVRHHWSVVPELMKVYLVTTGSHLDLLEQAGASIMVSYGCCHRIVHQILPRFASVMIDSGGFQLQKETDELPPPHITVHQYARWLLTKVLPKYEDRVDGHFTLDILNNAKQTWANQQILESYGLKPIPIWHDGEELEYLDFFCKRYELVGIGGVQGSHRDYRGFKRLFCSLTHDYPANKFHLLGLGFAADKCRRWLEPHSIDFLTWIVPEQFGHRLEPGGKQTPLPPDADIDEELSSAIRVCMALKENKVHKI